MFSSSAGGKKAPPPQVRTVRVPSRRVPDSFRVALRLTSIGLSLLRQQEMVQVGMFLALD